MWHKILESFPLSPKIHDDKKINDVIKFEDNELECMKFGKLYKVIDKQVHVEHFAEEGYCRRYGDGSLITFERKVVVYKVEHLITGRIRTVVEYQ